MRLGERVCACRRLYGKAQAIAAPFSYEAYREKKARVSLRATHAFLFQLVRAHALIFTPLCRAFGTSRLSQIKERLELERGSRIGVRKRLPKVNADLAARLMSGVGRGRGGGGDSDGEEEPQEEGEEEGEGAAPVARKVRVLRQGRAVSRTTFHRSSAVNSLCWLVVALTSSPLCHFLLSPAE